MGRGPEGERLFEGPRSEGRGPEREPGDRQDCGRLRAGGWAGPGGVGRGPHPSSACSGTWVGKGHEEEWEGEVGRQARAKGLGWWVGWLGGRGLGTKAGEEQRCPSGGISFC